MLLNHAVTSWRMALGNLRDCSQASTVLTLACRRAAPRALLLAACSGVPALSFQGLSWLPEILRQLSWSNSVLQQREHAAQLELCCVRCCAAGAQSLPAGTVLQLAHCCSADAAAVLQSEMHSGTAVRCVGCR